MLDHFKFRLLRHKTLMRKNCGGIDWTRTRSLPSKLDCKRARVWDVGNHHGSPNEWDYWIFKLDDTGQVIWSVALGGSNGDNLYGLSSSDEIYLIGRTESNDGDVVNLTDTTSVWILNLSDYNNIQNFSLSPHIYIYPNPLHDRATLEFSKIIGNVLLKISSVDGKFVQQFEINSRRTILKIDAPPGIYIYTIQDRNNIVINSGDLIIY